MTLQYTPFITLTSTGGTLSESLGGTVNSTQTHSSPVTASANGTTSTTRSPTSTSSGFFSNFRPSSPKVQQPYGSTSTARDEIASFYASAIGRKGAIDRERDISQTSSETSTARNRRPNSVFDHVGGMLDRFGRRLQSRGEADRRRMSSSVNGINESALDVGESGSSVDDHVSSYVSRQRREKGISLRMRSSASSLSKACRCFGLGNVSHIQMGLFADPLLCSLL